LIGGQSTTTQNRLITLINGLYCIVGLPAPTVPLSSLGDDGAIGVVEPGSTAPTTIVNTDATVGAQVPPAAAPTTTLVTITRLPNTPGPLNTRLDQYPVFYEITTSPPVTFSQDVTIGICQIDDFDAVGEDFSRLKVGHNLSEGGFELLPRVDATFLSPANCTSLLGAVNRGTGVLNLVMRSMTRFADAVLLPEFAHAGAVGKCCLGGTVKTFSPFGAVDTLVNVTAVSDQSIVGLAAQPVPASDRPSVRVLTPAMVPVEGLTVTFSVPAGSDGSVNGAVQTTDANGIATVGGWTLGGNLGADSVVATVTPPHPGSGVDGDPVLFVATVLAPASSFDWEATGWSWKQVGTYPTYPSATVINDAVTSTTGYSGPVQAAFSMVSPPNTECSAYGTNASRIHSTVFGVNKIIAFRRDFILPGGATSGTMVFAVDNDFRVFVNGVEKTSSVLFTVGASGTSTGVDAHGYRNHDNCPERGDFALPLSGLSALSNSLVVIALDRGGSTYFDASVADE
jgi:hypothetical protein